MSRKKQEAKAFAAREKGSWKFHLVFNLKVERGQELRDWQRRSQSQKGKQERETQKQRQSHRHKVRDHREPVRPSQRHTETGVQGQQAEKTSRGKSHGP